MDDVFASALDVSPVAALMQAKVRDVARKAKDPTQLAAMDRLLKKEVIPELLNYVVTKSGVYKNKRLGTLGPGNYGAGYRRQS